MAKRATALDLVLPARNEDVPAYRWLYGTLRSAILAGNLRAGTRLPATRDLAKQYGLSRGTIVNAFEQLRSEGYVEGSVGSGTFVSKTLPDELLHVAPGESTKLPAPRERKAMVSDYGRRAKLFPGYESRPIRAFRPNLPALDLFPMDQWAQIATRRLRRLSIGLLTGCDPLGYPPLRRAVADYLCASRGVKCVAGQVAIVSGVQESLDLVARTFLNPGDRVCMENPGYPGAALVFEAFGAKISTARLNDDGDGAGAGQLPLQGLRLMYVTPGHQFPLGTTMSLARRLELLEWARQSGALILEDDYDSEYRYSGQPIPALQGLDCSGSVLYTGTFSKVLFPALRLGYLVVPPDLVDYFEATKSLTSRHAPVLEQAVLTDFITEGHFGRHLRRMREIYSERLSILLTEAHLKLAGLLEICGVEAGLQTAGWLGRGIDSESAATAAARRNVEVTPLSRYGRGRLPREGLQLGFAAVDGREIKRGVEDLAIALDGEGRKPRR